MKKIIKLQSISRQGFSLIVMATAMLFVLLVGVRGVKAEIDGQMDLGSSGSDVIVLQTYLATDAAIYPSGLINGHFDSLTRAAIERFQTAQRIVSQGTPATTGYGRVGPLTLARLNNLIFLVPPKFASSSTALLFKNVIATSTGEQINFGLPVRLKIPKINVDAAFQYVGLTPDGAMDMTKSLSNVNWFDLRARPGDNGNAVIGGHFNGGRNGMISVFDDLHKLLPDDKIYIEDDRGAIISFIVREIRSYAYTADATEVFDSSDGKAHLNLITCEGTWDEVSQNYSSRLVVFTDKE